MKAFLKRLRALKFQNKGEELVVTYFGGIVTGMAITGVARIIMIAVF